ncbi:Hypothetical protein IALB_1217 [Ignavibacterium album JCM 16511]|uniref:Uncharacterized protein n=1 Tax=Ignavibacterium album (strain DSM 19864 / JCM 16511 / NBRC 101810 / Mat9-16) TaxID=945713 RepID=I0AIX1_IGNAJ|nr:Hypothetical protein IALB_1217 [Ignavibacterium album JCM 16511]
MVRLKLFYYYNNLKLRFLGLNSTMVRLKQNTLARDIKVPSPSQFHYGSIKTG